MRQILNHCLCNNDLSRDLGGGRQHNRSGGIILLKRNQQILGAQHPVHHRFPVCFDIHHPDKKVKAV